MPRKKINGWKILGIFLGLFAVNILLGTKPVYAANWPVNQSEDDILGGHVHAKLTFSKDNSQDYTAVGDIVTVTTELTKLDDGPLADSFDQSSMVILYPDESQGLELLGQPTYTIEVGGATDTGEFVPSSKVLPAEIIDTTFNLYAQLNGDSFRYKGVMTPIKVNAADQVPDYDQEPYYSDQYSLKNILVAKGTVVKLSYQARVTEKAIQVNVGKSFIFHSAMFDSSLNGTGDFDFAHGFLTAEMPGIQEIGVSFDSDSKNQILDVRQANAVHLSGMWHSDPSTTVTETLTVDGQTVPVPEGSFKEDGTFDMTVDLSSFVTEAGELPVTINLKDNYGQTASDTANLEFQQMNRVPEIQLVTPADGGSTIIHPSTKGVPFQLQWKDDDSQAVTLFYKIDNGAEVTLEKVDNTTPGQWQTYQGNLPLKALALGTHQVVFSIEDSDGARAAQLPTFTLDVQPDILGFKEVDKNILFPTIAISNQVIQAVPTAPVQLSITDTADRPDAWQLMVKQVTDFKAGDQLLNGAVLSFVNGDQKTTLSPQSDGIALPVVQKESGEYGLVQSDTNHFQLEVPTGNVVGDYSADLEWTIVAAPS
jgi:hypothetical protein